MEQGIVGLMQIVRLMGVQIVMKVIGLTGNIACGKSSVSSMLRELGAYVIDADTVAREIVKKGEPAWLMIGEHFGEEYIGHDGEIDRRKLGELVFSDSQALEELNEIVHPIIVQKIDEKLQKLKEENAYKVVSIDAALLIETGCHSIVDQIWLVTLPYEIQLTRLMKRDRLTKEQAIQRINSQMPQDVKMKYADKIIDNSRDIEYTKKQVNCLWTNLID